MKNTIAILIATYSLTASAEQFDMELSIPYMQISRFHRALFDTAMARTVNLEKCKDAGTESDTRPLSQQYQCGEVPLGRIDSDKTKFVMNFPIEGKSGKDNGVKYKINGGKIALNLSRVQRKGTQTISRLDERTLVDIENSRKIGYDTYLKLTPKGDRMDMEMCLIFPGLTVSAEPVTLDGRIKKEISFFPDIDADLDIKIDLGRASFSTGIMCAELITKIDSNGIPSLELGEIKLPVLKDLEHVGLKIDVDADVGGFWGLIGGVTGLIGLDIEDTISSAVKEKVMELAQENMEVKTRDVRTGQWLKEFVNIAMLKKSVKKYSGWLSEEVSKVTHGTNYVDRISQSTCLAAALAAAVPSDLTRTFFRLCSQKIRFDLTLFDANAEYENAGCYSHFFNPRKIRFQDEDGVTETKWWADGCAIVHKLSVQVPDELSPLSKCLMSAWKDRSVPGEKCAGEINGIVTGLQDGSLANLVGTLDQVPTHIPNEFHYRTMEWMMARFTGVRLPSYQDMLSVW